MTGYTFNPDIIREYDIRGTVGEDLTGQDAYYIGRAFGTKIIRSGGDTVCVGYDGRHSSPAFETELIKGLVDCGITVERVGMGPTPLLYFAVKDHMADGGIMITGSHNPSHMNGFKMTLLSSPVYGAAIKELAELAAAGDFETGTGSIRDVDMADTYIERLLRDVKIDRPLKVAWDAGNGAGGAVLHKLVSKLPGEHILLYADVDGDFPNHHPDPTVDKNVEDLKRAVIEQKCDIGIAFDGDADRIGVIDDKGRIIRCDMLLAVYAREVLKNRPGAPIIADVKCSNALFREIKNMGGKPVMWKTGHSLIKSKMGELNAPLAGELSGHIFFADKYYGYDDALYCSVRLLDQLCHGQEGDQPIKLSALMENMPRPVNTPEIRLDVDESEKFKLVAKVQAHLKETLPDISMLDETDGARVTLAEGWWLLRASNTQACIVARAEANSKEDLETVKVNLQTVLRACGFELDL
ncbi:MAG: phosphomannomutase/phosphoglucomutase [Rhodospirillales bacterium]|nr:phosphomannomutase/phosphoglucomutase [Rhodospirillales bacterium]MCB9973721.1 phosphomannomutase/phosphoglucomutase [Rhodospirillales bacterium]